MCPYDSYPDPHDSQLCALWSENEYLKGVTSTTAPNGVPLGPGVSPNGDSGTAPNGVPLGPNVSPNGSPVASPAAMATTASPAAVAPNGVPLGPGVSPNGDSGTAPNGMPLGPNVSPNGAPVSSPAAVAPNGVVLGPGVSPNGDSGTAPNGVPLGPNVSPNGSPVASPSAPAAVYNYEGKTVNCPYAAYPYTSEYCSLWCSIQLLGYGNICAELPATAPNGVPLGPGVSPNGDTGTAPNGTPLGPGISPNGSPTQESTTPEPCPYLGFDEESTHCALWEELRGLESTQGPSPLSAPNGVPLGPGVSPNGDVGTAPNGSPLGPNISPNGSPTSSASLPSDVQEVRCLYADHPNVSSSLCELWCKVQEYNNMKCKDTSIWAGVWRNTCSI